MATPAPELRIKNFRGLREFLWAPSGLCLLVGANGAGKTTAIDALIFLRTLFERGHETALGLVGGQHLKHLDAPAEEPVEFELRVEGVTWRLRFPMGVMGIRGSFGEELIRDGDVVARAAMFDEGWYLGAQRMEFDGARTCAKVLWDREAPDWMLPLQTLLTSIRAYPPFELGPLRRAELVDARDSFLARSGRNLWSVLASWRGSPSRYKGQFDRVMQSARRAFPGLFETLEFDRGLPLFFRPDDSEADRGLPAGRMADGLLAGLLVLTGIVGAKAGSIVAFDEMESRLHPHAIRSLMSVMRREVEERGLTILLTTHSPVVLNEFRDSPEQVFVLERSVDRPTVPNAMTALFSEEWLAQAKLGTLYDRLAFGAPPRMKP